MKCVDGEADALGWVEHMKGAVKEDAPSASFCALISRYLATVIYWILPVGWTIFLIYRPSVTLGWYHLLKFVW